MKRSNSSSRRAIIWFRVSSSGTSSSSWGQEHKDLAGFKEELGQVGQGTKESRGPVLQTTARKQRQWSLGVFFAIVISQGIQTIFPEKNLFVKKTW